MHRLKFKTVKVLQNRPPDVLVLVDLCQVFVCLFGDLANGPALSMMHVIVLIKITVTRKNVILY